MSTRSLIARPTDDERGWEARYCHSDGYPSGVGNALWHLVRDHCKGDVKAALKILIDDHPAGWSNIVGHSLDNLVNWRKKPGFEHEKYFRAYRRIKGDDFLPKLRALQARSDRPECYCHGERSEEPQLFTMPTFMEGGDGNAEWIYILDPERRTMTIQKPNHRPAGKGRPWEYVSTYGSEQDWAPRIPPTTVTTVDLNGEEPDWNAIRKIVEGKD